MTMTGDRADQIVNLIGEIDGEDVSPQVAAQIRAGLINGQSDFQTAYSNVVEWARQGRKPENQGDRFRPPPPRPQDERRTRP